MKLGDATKAERCLTCHALSGLGAEGKGRLFLKPADIDYINAHGTSTPMGDELELGAVRRLFGDAISLAFWLNGTDSENCCSFRGGPYLDSRYFGEGVGIAVKKGNETVRMALNWALFRVWEQGRFTDLWLRYFPISPF